MDCLISCLSVLLLQNFNFSCVSTEYLSPNENMTGHELNTIIINNKL